MRGSVAAFGLVSALGFFLEYHAKCYFYNEIFLVRLFKVPLVIVLMWGVLGWAAWRMYKHRGLLPGVLTPLAIDLCVLEPLAFYTGLWIWAETRTPRIWFSTIGNYVVYVLVSAFAIAVYSRLSRTRERR